MAPVPGLALRNGDLGVGRSLDAGGPTVIAAEQLGGRARRGKIDGDFVAQRAPVGALVGDERFKRETRRVTTMRTKHPDLTIGSGPKVVKNKRHG